MCAELFDCNGFAERYAHCTWLILLVVTKYFDPDAPNGRMAKGRQRMVKKGVGGSCELELEGGGASTCGKW